MTRKMRPFFKIRQLVKRPTKLDLLIENFSLTHDVADLKNLLMYCSEHLETDQFTQMTLFLHKIRDRPFIKKAEHRALLHHFAIKMIPLALDKENRFIKLCINKMLRISQSGTIHRWGILPQKIFHSQRSFDYLYWNVIRMSVSPETQFKLFFIALACLLRKALANKIVDRFAFLQLLVVSLYRCLWRPDQCIITTAPQLNKFCILIVSDESASFSESICSEQLEKILKKIPPVISPKDLNVAAALLDTQRITYPLLGFQWQMAPPIDSPYNPCGKMIRKILENKLIPLIIQSQTAHLGQISLSLSIRLPLVLFKLVCEYYQEISCLDMKIVFSPETQGHQFKLFYQPKTSQEEVLAPDLKSDDEHSFIKF
jgi:hypothetical protein